MKIPCKYCGKELHRYPCAIKIGNSYCNTKCQLYYEYENGTRDKNEIIRKGRHISHKKLLEHNWLNDKTSRDKLRKIMQTDSYKKKARDCKLGKLNPMYGKRPWNFIAGEKQIYGTIDRGFNWKFIKSEIKIRDNQVCQICGADKNLQVHHFEPFRSTQNNNYDNLITLCSKCHGKIENQFYKIQSINKEFVENIDVYNLEVEDDHTYVADGHIVHNCRSKVEFEVDE